jgi:hypothetical protein
MFFVPLCGVLAVSPGTYYRPVPNEECGLFLSRDRSQVRGAEVRRVDNQPSVVVATKIVAMYAAREPSMSASLSRP